MRRPTGVDQTIVVTMILGTMAYAIAEEITLTTYYPSPRGVYDELRANNLVLGNTSSPGNVQVSGSLSVGPSFSPGNAGDVLIEGNVGIGTNSPQALLDVAPGSGQIGLTITDTSGASQALATLIGQNAFFAVDGQGYIQVGAIGRDDSRRPLHGLDILQAGLCVGDPTFCDVSGSPSNGAVMKGRVGIGTANPETALHIVANSPDIILGPVGEEWLLHTTPDKNGDHFLITNRDKATGTWKYGQDLRVWDLSQQLTKPLVEIRNAFGDATLGFTAPKGAQYSLGIEETTGVFVLSAGATLDVAPVMSVTRNAVGLGDMILTGTVKANDVNIATAGLRCVDRTIPMFSADTGDNLCGKSQEACVGMSNQTSCGVANGAGVTARCCRLRP